MNILKLAAFSHNGQGGNPAGVAFSDAMPTEEEMLKIAKEVGYSETAFLVKQDNSLARALFCAGDGSSFLRSCHDCFGRGVGRTLW